MEIKSISRLKFIENAPEVFFSTSFDIYTLIIHAEKIWKNQFLVNVPFALKSYERAD